MKKRPVFLAGVVAATAVAIGAPNATGDPGGAPNQRACFGQVTAELSHNFKLEIDGVTRSRIARAYAAGGSV